MKEQSFKNHGRYIFMFHIVTYAAICSRDHRQHY